MKRLFNKKLLTGVLVLLAVLCLYTMAAAEWSVDGEGVLTISGDGEIDSYYNSGKPGGPWGKNIRKLVIGEGITGIGSYAFYCCEDLTEVSLPESLTSIGFESFYGCSALESIVIPAAVTEIKTFAFSECTGLKTAVIRGSLSDESDSSNRFEEIFRGSSSLERIDLLSGNGAYCSVDGIVYNNQKDTLLYCPQGKQGVLVIPDSVKEIPMCACKNCTRLTGVVFPAGLRSIDNEAFSGCISLTDVTIPEGITEISREAFAGCTSLKSVILPCSAERILWWAFSGCALLTDITIPNPVSVYEGAFSGCSSLTAVPENACDFEDSHVFENCTSLTSVTVPYGRTRIGDWAFDGCSSLKTVTFPKTLEYIGDYSFRNTALTEITVYEALEYLGDYAFNGYVIANVPSDSLALKLFSFDSTRRVKEFDQINEVTVTTDGNGKASADPSSGKSGTPVTLKAVPDAGYRFAGWEIIEGVDNIEDDRFYIGFLDVKIKACFEAAPIDISDARIAEIREQEYTGKAVRPTVTVRLDGKKLTRGTDYKVSYKNNKAVGKATVTITGIGNYIGSVKATFKIVPKKITLSSVKPGSKKLTVRWKKGGEITGYEIQYSLKKSFKSQKSVMIKKAKTTSITIKKLTQGKTYYVRIRAYKTVKGKKYYSAWSKALKAKVK